MVCKMCIKGAENLINHDTCISLRLESLFVLFRLLFVIMDGSMTMSHHGIILCNPYSDFKYRAR